ncbi:hypothetical protein D3C77_657810 [compost metagenome]
MDNPDYIVAVFRHQAIQGLTFRQCLGKARALNDQLCEFRVVHQQGEIMDVRGCGLALIQGEDAENSALIVFYRLGPGRPQAEGENGFTS